LLNVELGADRPGIEAVIQGCEEFSLKNIFSRHIFGSTCCPGVAGLQSRGSLPKYRLGKAGMVLAMIDEELLASIARQMMSGNTGDAD
jgi:hypothetical protein